MIFFTIVVPVYNLENYLSRALDSIFKQDFNIDLFEVIAIDDGSSDSSLSILNKYAQRYSNLRVYHQKNQGVSVARNLGLKYASGQYVTFLDGDDEFYLDSLSRVYSILKSHDIDVLYCYSFVNDGTKKLKQSHRTPPSVKNYEVCSIKQLANFLNGGSVCGGFYKIKLLDKFKLKFPENIMNSEDAIFNYSLFSHNPSIMFSDIKLYMVHVRPGSASRSDSLTRAKHFSRNIDYIVDYMETEQMSEFQYQYLSLALFQSFGCGVDMLLKVGVNDLCKIKEILHYKRLPALKAPKNLLFKKFQFFLLNHSFSVYLLIFKLRNKFKLNSMKGLIAHIVSKLSPKFFFIIAYVHNRKRVPDFKHPRDLSEIWIKYILDGMPKEIYWLADKYRVRDFVKSKGLDNILVPLVGEYVWDKCPSKEDIAALPSRFALKMNYGAGMNLVCMNKNKFNVDEALTTIKEWFERPADYSYSESHYNLIERKLVCEAYIEDHHGGFPTDYKFMCIHGKPFCVLACTGRESGNADYMPFTLDWKPLPEYTKNGDLYEIPKPKELDKMINIATKLADGLDLVRVDLYDTGTKIYFGEITLTPAGAIFHNWSQKALDDMGAFYYKTMKK